MKEKIKKNKGFIQIPILIAIIFSFIAATGIGYGVVEYNKTSKIIKEAEQLSKKEKYNEAIGKLELAQNKLLGKIILKQKISTELTTNKKLLGDKTKYDEGVNKLNEGNLQGSIDLLSELPESSFYYQKAQTKIEESKRKMVEGELSEEQIARKGAEVKAKQEEFEKNLKEKQLSDKAAEEKMMNTDNDGDGLTYREELSKGISDFNRDSDGDGINDKQDTHPAGGGRNIAQTFAWSYGGYNWTWTANIQEDWYDYYKAKPRVSVSNVEYVTYNDPFIQAVAKKISEAANEKSLSKDALAAAFVQGLSYVDDIYTGYDEYPKYPVETFIEKNGDCEDTSYLTASIIRAMNIDTVLILLPGHVAVGVWLECNNPGTFYKSNDRCYYYTETTGNDWFAGEIPDKYKSSTATLIKIPSGETATVVPQYKEKPCIASKLLSGYYTRDEVNYYYDSSCYNMATCLPAFELCIILKLGSNCSVFGDKYWDINAKDVYWDNRCTQQAVPGCEKSTTYPGYFFNGVDWYYDSRCTQRARICRPSTVYSDRYWDGDYNYWDSSCTQKVVSWCTKSIYYPGYFFNSIDGKIYIDYQCTIKK